MSTFYTVVRFKNQFQIRIEQNEAISTIYYNPEKCIQTTQKATLNVTVKVFRNFYVPNGHVFNFFRHEDESAARY